MNKRIKPPTPTSSPTSKFSKNVIKAIAKYESNKLECERLDHISISRNDPKNPHKATGITGYLKDFPTLQNRLQDEYGQAIFKAYAKWEECFVRTREQAKVKIDAIYIRRGEDGKVSYLDAWVDGGKQIIMR